MKKYLLSYLLILFCSQAFSQITLGTNDFSHAGDMFTVSNATAFQGMNPATTGTNYYWDYSRLDSTTTGQTVDTIFSVAQTGVSTYTLLFGNTAFSPYKSDQAKKESTSFTYDTISISNVWDFYSNTGADFHQSGFGARINGFDAPFGASPVEIIYKYPLQYGNMDSSIALYTLPSYPGITFPFYFSEKRNRHNVVDGWGTVTTPFGTFECLRMKSTIDERDSIGLDTIAFGFNQPQVVLYKWVAVGEGIPVLQINTGAGGNVTSIVYLGYPVCRLAAAFDVTDTTLLVGDSLNLTNLTTSSGNFEWKLNGNSYSTDKNTSIQFPTAGTYTVTLIQTSLNCADSMSRIIRVIDPELDMIPYPNPSSDNLTIKCTIPLKSDITLTMYDVIGQLVAVKTFWNQDAGEHLLQFDASPAQFASDKYFIKMTWKFGDITKPLLITKW